MLMYHKYYLVIKSYLPQELVYTLRMDPRYIQWDKNIRVCDDEHYKLHLHRTLHHKDFDIFSVYMRD